MTINRNHPENSKAVRDVERKPENAVTLPADTPGDDTRELARVTGTTPVEDPREFARKRRLRGKDINDLAPGEGEDRAEDKSAQRKLSTVSTPAESIVWTGRNVNQVLEFCGPDPLGQPAATFSRFWDGDGPELTVFNRSAGDNGVGGAHAVRKGQTIVRADQHADGGWGVLHPADDDELEVSYKAA